MVQAADRRLVTDARFKSLATPANLGNGTPTSATALFGDGTWKTPPSTGSGTSNVLTPEQYGAVGDGSTNDTTALQAALNAAAGKILQLKPGTAYVGAGLMVSAATTVTGYGATIKAPANSGNDIFSLNAVAGCSLAGLSIDGNKGGGATGSAVRAQNTTGLTLRDLTVKNTGFKSLWLEPNNTDWTIRGCRITGSAGTAITVAFSSRGLIEDCSVDSCDHGIQIWGGDSADGSQTGWIDNISVVGCRVSNVVGGIFTSRARYVAVTGCVVDTCSDVGIDFEGGYHCTAVGNSVRQCNNGALTTFYAARDILFANNVVDQGSGMGPGYKSYGNGTSKRIKVDNNIINCVDSLGCYFDQSTVTDCSFSNNAVTITGSGVKALRSLLNNGLRITGNVIVNVAPSAIANEGGVGCVIENNHMTFNGTDNSTPGGGDGAIFNFFKDSTYTAQRNRIRGNVAIGYKVGICDANWGDSNKSFNLVQDNAVDVIVRYNSASYKGVVLDNRTIADPTAASTVTIVT